MRALRRGLGGGLLLALGLATGCASGQVVPEPPLADCDMDGFARVLQPLAVASGEARAFWLDARHIRWPGMPAEGTYRLYHSASGQLRTLPGAAVAGADGMVELMARSAALDAAVAERFAWVPGGAELSLPSSAQASLAELLRSQLLIVREDAGGRVRDVTALQPAGALDALYAAAAQPEALTLGAQPQERHTDFALWAPTARAVSLCLYPDANAPAEALLPMQADPLTGAWTAQRKGNLHGRYYTFLVDVFVRGVGLVRNRVTDPYALSLSANSRRGFVADLQHPELAPPGWWDKRGRVLPESPVDLVIYELHVRDFSIGDASVPADRRGTYLAFAEADTDGVRHLRALAQAGVTDVHLLPVFDIATIPEVGCVTPNPSGAPDGEAQQAAVAAVKDRDCYNWGYDPFHFTAPEGSYATDPDDGAARILEFRAMVQGLHRLGLRVGMDVVYNHTSASGQNERSVLDRIVPGYYQRYDLAGRVERSTCCENTATENAMMARLMIDSVVTWAREHRIDSFRFDLMGHQPRAAMQELKARVDAATGRRIDLLGEGWNFGEVANGARFVQASQLSLPGTGIATFSDRLRDAARGGGCCDGGNDLVIRQGWLNGLHYAPNASAVGRFGRDDLLRAADLMRVGLAGSVRDYRLVNRLGAEVELAALDYAGQPAGYVAEPTEVVNYVENHDNPTLYDLNAYKLARPIGAEERARVQVLGAAVVAFSQGIAYLHAGQEILRSKSMDRNSYDSGDWFNRVDWSYQQNFFGSGLPPAWDNQSNWHLMRPLLADASIRPAPGTIRWTRDAVLDLLRIRSGTTLLRLRSAADIRARLSFPDAGPQQLGSVLVGHVDGEDYPGAAFRELMYFINADVAARELSLPAQAGKPWVLHPLLASPEAADPRPREQAQVDVATGRFHLPPRTALVYVLE